MVVFTGEEIKLLAIGNIVAFVVALLAIKFFIEFLKKYGFQIWGIYRVIVGYCFADYDLYRIS